MIAFYRDNVVGNFQLLIELNSENCDSFDVVRDSLGLIRTDFPHTVYCVAGTQVSFIAVFSCCFNFFDV